MFWGIVCSVQDTDWAISLMYWLVQSWLLSVEINHIRMPHVSRFHFGLKPRVVEARPAESNTLPSRQQPRQYMGTLLLAIVGPYFKK